MTLSLGQAILTLRGNMQALNKNLGQAERIVKTRLGKMAGFAKKYSAGMIKFGAAVTGGLALAVKKTVTFEDAFAKVMTLGVKNADALRKGLFGLSTTMGTDLIEATEQLYQAMSKGMPEDAAILVLEAAQKGAYAGSGTLTDALNLGTSVMNAYGLATDDTNTLLNTFEKIMGVAATAVKYGSTTFGEMADVMGRVMPTANALGVSMDEVFSAISAITASGQPTSEAISGMKAALWNMANVTSKSEEALNRLNAEILRQHLGIDISNLRGKEYKETLAALVEKHKDITIQFSAAGLKADGLTGIMEKLKGVIGDDTDAMVSLFGSIEGFNAMMSLTGAGAELYAKVLNQSADAQKNLNEMSDAYIKKNPAIAFRKLKGALDVLAVKVGRDLLPVLTPLVEGFAALLRLAQKIPGPIWKLVGVLGPLALALGSVARTAAWTRIAFAGAGAIKGAGAAAGIGAGARIAGAGAGAVAGAGGMGLLATGGLIAAIAVTTALVVTAVGAWMELKDAQKGVKQTTIDADKSTQVLIQSLEKKGVVLDKEKIMQMDAFERDRYLIQLMNETKAAKENEIITTWNSVDAWQAWADAVEQAGIKADQLARARGLIQGGGGPPRYQHGGTMRQGGMALVGERGPELVRLPAGARVYNARETANKAGMTVNGPLIQGPLINHAVIREDSDVGQLAQTLGDMLVSRYGQRGIEPAALMR